MVETLIIGIVALALLKGRKATGVGKVPKRRIFTEIATAQNRGIDFSMPYDEADSKVLSELAKRFGFRPSARSSKSTAEQYFNSLRRTYNAVSGIGATDLPYSTSVVRNANGDVIITYNDYGTTEQERKARISYLGSAAKGGKTLDQLTHYLWESSGGYDRGTDDSAIYDGVEQAVLSCQSMKQAQQDILDMYYSAHQIQEEDPNAVFDESMNDEKFAQINNDINYIIANYPSGNGSRAAMIYRNVLPKYGSLSNEWLERIGVKTYTDLENLADNYDGNQQYNNDMPF